MSETAAKWLLILFAVALNAFCAYLALTVEESPIAIRKSQISP